jgi:hypothetical protein
MDTRLCSVCGSQLVSCSIALPVTISGYERPDHLDPQGFREGILSTAFCGGCGHMDSFHLVNFKVVGAYLNREK